METTPYGTVTEPVSRPGTGNVKGKRQPNISRSVGRPSPEGRRKEMEDSFVTAAKQAFREANVGDDCEFEYKAATYMAAAVKITQCGVSYKSGNEYLRLDILLQALGSYGRIDMVELRGRGGNDVNQILIDMDLEGSSHQVIYLLPSEQGS